jgi:hypothetical protein
MLVRTMVFYYLVYYDQNKPKVSGYVHFHSAGILRTQGAGRELLRWLRYSLQLLLSNTWVYQQILLKSWWWWSTESRKERIQHIGDHGTPNAYKLLTYSTLSCVRFPAWIEIHWSRIWLRVRSHGNLNYTWGFVTALHDFGGVLGRTTFAHFFWGALTISWCRLIVNLCVKWS